MRLPWVFAESWVWTLMVGGAGLAELFCEGNEAQWSAEQCWHALWAAGQRVPLSPASKAAYEFAHALTAHACPHRPCAQVYFCVGFVTSPRLLAFWAISFTMGLFALTLFLACASLMRKIPTANALQVRGSEAQVVRLAIFCAPLSAAAAVCVVSAAYAAKCLLLSCANVPSYLTHNPPPTPAGHFCDPVLLYMRLHHQLRPDLGR